MYVVQNDDDRQYGHLMAILSTTMSDGGRLSEYEQRCIAILLGSRSGFRLACPRPDMSKHDPRSVDSSWGPEDDDLIS